MRPPSSATTRDDVLLSLTVCIPRGTRYETRYEFVRPDLRILLAGPRTTLSLVPYLYRREAKCVWCSILLYVSISIESSNKRYPTYFASVDERRASTSSTVYGVLPQY